MNIKTLVSSRRIFVFCLILVVATCLIIGYSGSPQPAVFKSKPAQMPVTYPFSFQVTGDTRLRTNIWEQLRLKSANQAPAEIVRKMAELNPSFVINTGDLVFKGESQSDWARFDAINKIWNKKNICYYPVLGNHDYDGDQTKILNNYFSRFPDINRQRWYTFNYGNAAFIILDSNFDKPELNEQDNWLAKTLVNYEANSAISFIFVCFHHPPFTNSKNHSPDETVKTRFVPLFEKSAKVKFVFTGHHHSYERFKVNGINYIVTGGGGARLYTELEPDKRRLPDEYSPNKPRGFHFCSITVWPEKIQFRTFHLDQTKLSWQDGDLLEVAR